MDTTYDPYNSPQGACSASPASDISDNISVMFSPSPDRLAHNLVITPLNYSFLSSYALTKRSKSIRPLSFHLGSSSQPSLKPKANTKLYYIIPDYEKGNQVISRFTQKLSEDTDAETLVVRKSDGNNFVSFWMQRLSPKQAEELRSEEAVEDVISSKVWGKRRHVYTSGKKSKGSIVSVKISDTTWVNLHPLIV